MEDWKKANEEINAILEAGEAMEAFEKHYHDEVEMQENESDPRKGKVLNREQCGAFTQMFPDLKLKVLSTAYGENLSIQEVLFDYTNEEGKRIYYPEIAVRKWKGDKVIQEKFYYAS